MVFFIFIQLYCLVSFCYSPRQIAFLQNCARPASSDPHLNGRLHRFEALCQCCWRHTGRLEQVAPTISPESWSKGRGCPRPAFKQWRPSFGETTELKLMPRELMGTETMPQGSLALIGAGLGFSLLTGRCGHFGCKVAGNWLQNLAHVASMLQILISGIKRSWKGWDSSWHGFKS